MKAILVPVKAFGDSKKRLTAHFPPQARAALARALCEDFFKVVAAVRGVDRIFVVSSEPMALGWARERGWETIVETTQTSESASVDAASRICAKRGVTALLRIPIDLPLVEFRDVEELFAALVAAPSTVLTPSRDGTGTNALLRSPPTLFPSHFGPDSFVKHLAESERVGARTKIIRNPRLGWDVDEREDFTDLAPRLKPGSATAQWFNEHQK